MKIKFQASSKMKYPCLKTSPCDYGDKTECIVLFTSANIGICINPGATNNKIGTYSQFWNEYDFIDYNGKITISN
jgi:hypothetical protein